MLLLFKRAALLLALGLVSGLLASWFAMCAIQVSVWCWPARPNYALPRWAEPFPEEVLVAPVGTCQNSRRSMASTETASKRPAMKI
jgi:hypothetical protein